MNECSSPKKNEWLIVVVAIFFLVISQNVDKLHNSIPLYFLVIVPNIKIASNKSMNTSLIPSQQQQ